MSASKVWASTKPVGRFTLTPHTLTQRRFMPETGSLYALILKRLGFQYQSADTSPAAFSVSLEPLTASVSVVDHQDVDVTGYPLHAATALELWWAKNGRTCRLRFGVLCYQQVMAAATAVAVAGFKATTFKAKEALVPTEIAAIFSVAVKLNLGSSATDEVKTWGRLVGPAGRAAVEARLAVIDLSGALFSNW